jgi:hypothetical protein
MKSLSVQEAASRTGLSRTAIYGEITQGALLARGTPLHVDEEDLNRFIVDRQRAAASRVGDLERFAEEARRYFQRPSNPSRRGTWTLTDQHARDIFGPHVVKAAGMSQRRGCRWCWARMASGIHGGLEPQLTDAHRLLLGEPCRLDLEHIRDRLFGSRKPQAGDEYAPIQASGTPAPARYMGAKVCGTPVGQPCTCHPGPQPKPNNAVTASTWTPPPDDNGAQLVAHRRTELNQRIQDAKERGDHAYAAQLRRLLGGLTASAAKPTPKTTRRVQSHGCGCGCEQHRGQS